MKTCLSDLQVQGVCWWMAQLLNQICLNVMLLPDYFQLMTVRDTVMTIPERCRTPLMPTLAQELHSYIAGTVLKLYQSLWPPTQPSFLPSVPYMGQPCITVWQLFQTPLSLPLSFSNTPPFFLTGVLPSKWDHIYLLSRYLLLGRPKLAEFEMLINKHPNKDVY